MKSYDEIQGWFGFESTYDFLVSTVPSNGTFVECGAWLGRSSAYLCDIAKDRDINIYIIDTWKGSPSEVNNHHKLATEINLYKAFNDNMSGRNYTAIKEDSIIASGNFADNSLDVVFIDMDHTYDSVCKDIDAWLPKVKESGYLAGHDYMDCWPSVKRAVDDKLGKVDIMAGCWLYKK